VVASNQGYRLRREKSEQGILAPVQDASVRVRADTDIFEEALMPALRALKGDDLDDLFS
jgi:hypothetical protein